MDTLRNPKYRLALNLYYIQQGEIMNVSKTTFFRYLKLALTELADLITHAEKEK
ncbi:DUF1492 domain-containing protein [Streptococcus suis]|uniref:DUF1492 domain-containing protein n=1 Tax=Streptococcus suis TaxID=1307 RepID=UPI001E2EB5E4|nr:DUF1492 domain-containing protein [Streptococcus suis]